MREKKTIPVMLIFLLFVLVVSVSFAQEGRGRGRIRGSVEDESGKPLVGVKIIAESVDHGTKFESKSSKKGTWAIGGLGSGFFIITTEFEGYEPHMEKYEVSQFIVNNPPINIVLKKKEEVLASESGIDATLVNEGNQLFSEKKYAEALAKYKEFLETNPNLYQVHINVGNCYKELGELDSAIAAYQTMLDKTTEEKGSFEGDQNAARALAGLGQVYIEKNDIEKAMDYLQQAFSIFPDDENMAFRLGEILFTQAKAAEAIVYYDKAIAIKSDWAPPYRQKGYAYLNLADYKRAVESFKKFLELAPNHPQASTVRSLIPQIEKMIKM
jgi:tetratricopeptide (TPR) repeat protein